MAFNYVARSIRVQFDSDALSIYSAAAIPEPADTAWDFDENFYSIKEINRRKIKLELAQYLQQKENIPSQYYCYFQQLPEFKLPKVCEVAQACEQVQIQCFTSYRSSLTANIHRCQSQRTTDVDPIVIGSIEQVQLPSGQLIRPCDIVIKDVSPIQCVIHYKHRMKGFTNTHLTFLNCLKKTESLPRISQFIMNKITSYLKRNPCYIQNIGEGMPVQIQILKHLTKRNIQENDIYVLGKSTQLNIVLIALSFKQMCQYLNAKDIYNNNFYISWLLKQLKINKVFGIPAQLRYALVCDNPIDIIQENEQLSEQVFISFKQLKEVMEFPVLKFVIENQEYYILGRPDKFTTIGTRKSNHIVIKGLSISERQTFIGYKSGWFIGDGPTTCECQSNFGTWRVMRKGEQCDLYHGQQFRVADQRFRFMELYNNFVLQQH